MPLPEETRLMKLLNQEGYVLKKLNLTYWQAVSIRGQGSYAVSLQSDSYCVIPLQGTEPESQRLQNLINASFAL